jgi:3-oxoacyl-[acyl-carrier-protein] synthase-3
VFGTDGRGAANLIVAKGGHRYPAGYVENEASSNSKKSSGEHLFMNGGEILSFTLKAVPEAVSQVLSRADISLDAVDLFFFHQANQFILENLRKKIGIPPEKFIVAMEHSGNTVSSTIPIALKEAVSRQSLRHGNRILLAGFGVGYSWAAGLVRWTS